MEPKWTAAVSAVWGKTGDGEAWLPLVAHLEDAAAVAERLWDTWLPVAVKARVTAACGGDGEVARALYIWVAAVHDIAKATPAFAQKARAAGAGHLLDAMERVGLPCPAVPRDEAAHHTVMGQVFLEEALRETGLMTRKQARSVAVVVGGHHGAPPTKNALSVVRRVRRRRGRPAASWGDAAWESARREIFDWACRRVDLSRVAAALPATGLPIPVQVDLTGALIVADWLASDETRFPYDGLAVPEVRRARGVEVATLPPPWRPGAVDLENLPGVFAERFPRLAGLPLRPMQDALARACGEVTEPPLVIVEAPMGSGKTEAALVAAEVLASRFGGGGTFLALPTMATSDAMFGRVLDWLRHVPGDDPGSVFLAHSKAALNPDYRALTLDGDGRFGGVYDEENAGRAAPVVDSWMRGRKRGVLADHVVGTIDQVLFGALQTKHVALRHLALSGKVVVVDEVHAADDFMRTFLCRALEWFAAYRVPVLLLSATLPPAQRLEYARAYARGRGFEIAKVPEPPTYPCLTVVSDRAEVVDVADRPVPTNVEIRSVPGGDIGALLEAELAEGGCAVVIRNTVGRAQQTYEDLRRRFGDDVMLVHSRFIGPDRARLEEELRARLGPPGEGVERPGRFIVVGTQVLEQSIDADADVMVTDIAPIDLVLQRMGRLHRHAREARPGRLVTPRLYVAGVTPGATPTAAPTFERGDVVVYGEYRLLRAAAELRPHLDDRKPVVLPDDIPRLVMGAYDEETDPPPGWESRWQAARATYEKDVAGQRQRAQSFLLPAPQPAGDLVGWLTSPVATESDDAERVGRAQVRDTEDSLEVVLAVRGEDGLLHVMPGAEYAGRPIPTQIGPRDEGIARAASTCTVRLPRALCHPGVIDAVIADLERRPEPAGWQTSRWLRGQLVLPLAEDFSADLAGHVIRYDRRLGLLVDPQATTEENA